ncbi:probable methyltransferase PMT11 [Dendrobium catenatum]|uniref:Methyltransferase n=1 Tax=Dendrobium catenatum TaxID=906689 RepID=A0A2I0WN45_9ASPA|nr:probable methyltransferase PMT11 [Dendrobium catenatum]PKU77092.1 putative methyltransferase PMT11 [Dendrobium catenatum]
MKGELGDPFKLSSLTKISFLFLACIASFYLGRNWNDGSMYPQLIFYSNVNPTAGYGNANLSVTLSPNLKRTSDITTPVSNESSLNAADPVLDALSRAPAPPVVPKNVGIVDENGAMREDFDAGSFDSDLVEEEEPPSWAGNETNNEIEKKDETRVRIQKFGLCPERMREYIPCLDNEEEIKKLNSTERGERFERHCPAKEQSLNCLIPAPKGYREPIPWPISRDEVWFSNVPHTRLVEDKGGQNWIKRDKEKFKFPGGGTQFIHGADSYLDQISEMVPGIAFGNRTRVVLDVGCGVASFGAFLLSRDVITMSIAPKDLHENQIQFALERGVPAMVAAFATRRLLYPSQAFDLLHCSRCRINWTRDDGILLLEANRMLRAGGYFAWAAQPVYKHEEAQQETWKEMENLTSRICWELVKKKGYLAIWRKPLNNTCYLNRSPEVQPPLCGPEDDSNSVWYVNLKACISQLLENASGANITAWPARLHEPPLRLQGVEMDAYIAKNELFRAETRFWNDIVEGYIRIFHWKKMNIRNVMDMRAGFGGFASALIDQKMNSWVMNVVPISGPNTLPVIYDRGLIGVAHDWCEPFDTYPRTYDLLHAFGLFSIEHKRCNLSVILLEMDRILRPGGRAYIRDSKFITEEIKEITEAMGWKTELRDTAEGPYASRKVLIGHKEVRHS